MKSILLIEDDPFLIDIYNTKLKEAGFSVEIATEGEEGLKKLAEKKFDLLILDIVLPRITGWEILKKIRIKN
jgi:DNA-binding response OmpR family regulator